MHTEAPASINSPRAIRELIRRGKLARTTSGMALGHVQANLVVLPKDMAFEFLLFCQRNPKPCPLIEVVEAGSAEPKQTAPGADLRVDLGKYRVYKDGRLVDEPDNISKYWRDDFVSFLLGCSFSFESALMNGGMSLRHIERGSIVSMYITNIQTEPTDTLSGPVVVSMRPLPRDKVVRAVQITSRFPAAHGAPLHIGDPEAIGIRDLATPDLGDPTPIEDGEVPLFWACGVTPQVVAMNAKPPLMITHSPGFMFITDQQDEDLAVL